MKQHLEQLISSQFLRFLVAGGISAVVNYAVGYALSGLLPFHGDVVVGYLAGMGTAFFLFERSVFGEHVESRRRSVGIFILVNALGLLQTWLIFTWLVTYYLPKFQWSFYPEHLARAVAIITPTLTSYICHKYFTFRQ